MKLEIRLKNSLECDGCPLVKVVHELGVGNVAYCKYYSEKLKVIDMVNLEPITRLKTCLRQNGE